MNKQNQFSEKKCYIIGAVDENHNGEVNLAKEMIDIAIQCGCNAVKFQKRCVDLIAIRSVLNKPCIKYPNLGKTYREIREKLELSIDEYRQLIEYVGDRIDFIVAPYDVPSLIALDAFGLEMLKIDSPCATNIPLLEEIAERKKKVIVSTGACTEEEIKDIVDLFQDNQLTLLHSIHAMPFDVNFVYLNVIKWLQKFGSSVGYSDNEPGATMAIAAIAFGAKVIEKNFTLDKNMEGFKHSISLNQEELRILVDRIREVEGELADSVKQRIISMESDFFDNERV